LSNAPTARTGRCLFPFLNAYMTDPPLCVFSSDALFREAVCDPQSLEILFPDLVVPPMSPLLSFCASWSRSPFPRRSLVTFSFPLCGTAPCSRCVMPFPCFPTWVPLLCNFRTDKCDHSLFFVGYFHCSSLNVGLLSFSPVPVAFETARSDSFFYWFVCVLDHFFCLRPF